MFLDIEDVKSGVYEGGSVLWECSIDLINYLKDTKIQYNHSKVLDLGCGQGTVGIYALKECEAAHVHFTDYNEEVIERNLMDSVFINDIEMIEKMSASSGDWSKLELKGEKYDLILTSETIYNVDYYPRLVELLERALAQNGIILLAAKSHYFGCGGSVVGFTKYLENDEKFDIEEVWKSKSNDALERSILRIKWRAP